MEKSLDAQSRMLGNWEELLRTQRRKVCGGNSPSPWGGIRRDPLLKQLAPMVYPIQRIWPVLRIRKRVGVVFGLVRRRVPPNRSDTESNRACNRRLAGDESYCNWYRVAASTANTPDLS